MKSQEFNEYDKCFPNGVYNGVDRDGNTKCTCGAKNQHCSNEFVSELVTDLSPDIFSNLLSGVALF
jgi:hypothetical protein